MKILLIRIYGMQLKQCWEVNFNFQHLFDIEETSKLKNQTFQYKKVMNKTSYTKMIHKKGDIKTM